MIQTNFCIIKTMDSLTVEQWKNWEQMFKELLTHQRNLFPNEILIGYEDDSGKISYSSKTSSIKKEIKNQFNELDYIIPLIVSRKYVEHLPSLARVMPNANPQYLILHPFENEDEDVQAILDLFDQDLTYGICILDSEASDLSHGIAFIAWKKGDVSHFAFYDPLSYKKKRVRPDGSVYFAEYDYAPQVLQWIQEVIEEEHPDFEWKVHDLSVYCLKKSEEEFDCPQYHMNAEYCYFYSLHFLYTWAGLGFPLTSTGFAKAVEKSYIINMNKLNRSYTLDTMYYKIIMYSFIVTVFIKYFQGLDEEEKKWIPNLNLVLAHLEKIVQTWFNDYNIPLLVV